MSKYRVSSDGTAIVDDTFKMYPINNDTPRGYKMLLLNSYAGILYIGVLGAKTQGATHWSPCLTTDKDDRDREHG